ncbi:MAG TPA: NAD-dependent malic enzyme [Steroidobacteraceae bacterium]|jgi:malate dehydrogenase (oxaloacetate-decarboxylating)|nr:NAD-dependent malic enzyme [Steroidobacteraceae bacterium]
MHPLFDIRRDPATGAQYLQTPLSGHELLDQPLLNKGTAFTAAERRELGLTGLLPPGVSTPEVQLARIYGNYRQKTSNLERYIHLVSLQDRNETAFYRLLNEHLVEMMPIIYTPVVGEACQAYSRIYRRPRGLYIAYPQRDSIDAALANLGPQDISIVVVTDGERILGLGDLGIGGMGIPIGKLSLYTVCAGIHPASTLPVILDVGTNNQELLNDPLYVGWRHERIRGAEYDAFVEAFVVALGKRFPRVLLQWEDFARHNAARLLERYRDRLCSFNDDIQGTGAVALAVAMAGAAAGGTRFADQRVVLLGAGSAAAGITRQLVTGMRSDGLSEDEARRRIWLVDAPGLVHSQQQDLDAFKTEFARPFDTVADWAGAPGHIPLLEVVKRVRPTILIGAAAQPQAFNEAVVREMARHVTRPMILPLSNPTSKCEALPVDLINWTEGRALIATGSPFDDVEYQGRKIRIGQCNNAYIFPGVGLGVIAAQARRVTDAMFIAAARTLSELAPVRRDPSLALLPQLREVREVAQRVAVAVAVQAQRDGVADELPDDELVRRIDATMWTPEYLPYRRVR